MMKPDGFSLFLLGQSFLLAFDKFDGVGGWVDGVGVGALSWFHPIYKPGNITGGTLGLWGHCLSHRWTTSTTTRSTHHLMYWPIEIADRARVDFALHVPPFTELHLEHKSVYPKYVCAKGSEGKWSAKSTRAIKAISILAYSHTTNHTTTHHPPPQVEIICGRNRNWE